MKIVKQGENGMELMKIMYYINVCVIIIEAIAIYMHNHSSMWLGIMLLSFILQAFCVHLETKKSVDKDEKTEI